MTAEQFPVERGHVLAFAHAIGDLSPVYVDADDPQTVALGGLVAPPTFTVAAAHHDPDNPLRPRPDVPWHGSGRAATGAERASGGSTTLHAEQHFTYHAPVHVGDVLTLSVSPGRTWQKRGSGARLSFSETITEHRNQHGDLVVTSRTVAVTLLPLDDLAEPVEVV